MHGATNDEMGEWCVDAIERVCGVVNQRPDAVVPAYPNWSLRDLTLHVIGVYEKATAALITATAERPSLSLAITRDFDEASLAAALRESLSRLVSALNDCRYETVWTPVGPGPPTFWRRRALREAILHRWDAEQALGHATVPDDRQALELIDEFLETDVRRALVGVEHTKGGVLAIRAGEHRWVIDTRGGTVLLANDAMPVKATVSGDPASIWLWLVRRHGFPGQVLVRDLDGTGRFFSELLDEFSRPAGST